MATHTPTEANEVGSVPAWSERAAQTVRSYSDGQQLSVHETALGGIYPEGILVCGKITQGGGAITNLLPYGMHTRLVLNPLPPEQGLKRTRFEISPSNATLNGQTVVYGKDGDATVAVGDIVIESGGSVGTTVTEGTRYSGQLDFAYSVPNSESASSLLFALGCALGLRGEELKSWAARTQTVAEAAKITPVGRIKRLLGFVASWRHY